MGARLADEKVDSGLIVGAFLIQFDSIFSWFFVAVSRASNKGKQIPIIQFLLGCARFGVSVYDTFT